MQRGKMKHVMLVSLYIGVFSTLAADTIPGGNVSGTWSVNNSPYYITGNITVPTNDTLIIQPGVSVNFLGYYRLYVYGCFKALGTETDSIHFFPEDTSTGWRGVFLSDEYLSGHFLEMRYCTFRYARTAIALSIWASPIIEHCDFTNNKRSAIGTASLFGTLGIKIMHCTFRNNIGSDGAAIYFLGFGFRSAEIVGCIFDNNTSTTTGGAIMCFAVAQPVIISDCIFSNNIAHYSGGDDGGGAIYSVDTEFDISHCTFFSNSAFIGGAMDIEWHDVGFGSFTLDHCTIWGNEGWGIGADGLYLQRFDANIQNSIFANHNNAAIYIEGGTISEVAYSDFFENDSNIWNNGGTIPINFGILDTINYNNDSSDIYFNIFMDPMFADTSNRNFHLTASSPCIDGGDPTYLYDPDNTITDIGAFWFDQTGLTETPVIRYTNNEIFLGTTIFSGPLLLPEGKDCRVFDITGRVIAPQHIKPGIYFVEVDGKIKQKVVKIR